MDATHTPISVTPRLGQWVSELTLEAVPADVVAHLKLCLLDSIGCGLYGAAQRWGKIAGDVVVGFSGGGVASLFPRAGKVSPPHPAPAHGTAVPGLGNEDAPVAASPHPGARTLP